MGFESGNYSEEVTVVDGVEVPYHAYRNICYVDKPVDVNFQYMNIYIPKASVNDRSVPVFLPNGIGGYMPSQPLYPSANASKKEGHTGNEPAEEALGSTGREVPSNIVSVALAEGCVVASPGARGNTSEVDGVFTGKAPAAIVDLKAAVRWLRHNDEKIPGNKDKIVSNGTSAGGAMSVLLGASGNSPLFGPYLKQLDAANERDDIFAAVCFCPVIDLEHADMAYEWLYNRVINDTDAQGKSLYGFTDEQKRMSDELKSLFPAWFNGLGLKSVFDGTPLTDKKLEKYISVFVIASAQKALDNGADMSGKEWLHISNGRVTDIDFDAYISYVTRFPLIKDPPAFDWLGDASTHPPRSFGSRENLLFGSVDTPAHVFTEYAAGRLGTEVPPDVRERLYLMNPSNFIGREECDTAPNWYIRHGTTDRDTAFSVPVTLYTGIVNSGRAEEVNFGLAWERPHSGDYELEELFGWIKKVAG